MKVKALASRGTDSVQRMCCFTLAPIGSKWPFPCELPIVVLAMPTRFSNLDTALRQHPDHLPIFCHNLHQTQTQRLLFPKSLTIEHLALRSLLTAHVFILQFTPMTSWSQMVDCIRFFLFEHSHLRQLIEKVQRHCQWANSSSSVQLQGCCWVAFRIVGMQQTGW